MKTQHYSGVTYLCLVLQQRLRCRTRSTWFESRNFAALFCSSIPVTCYISVSSILWTWFSILAPFEFNDWTRDVTLAGRITAGFFKMSVNLARLHHATSQRTVLWYSKFTGSLHGETQYPRMAGISMGNCRCSLGYSAGRCDAKQRLQQTRCKHRHALQRARIGIHKQLERFDWYFKPCIADPRDALYFKMLEWWGE